MKLKTNKTLYKKLKITSRKKMIRRKRQDYYSATPSGNTQRKKHASEHVSLSDQRGFRKLLPYIKKS